MIKLLIFFFLIICTPAFADTQVVTLKDGSQVKGELIGVSGGTYIISTPAMGEVKVESNQVVSIASESAAPAPAAVNAQPTAGLDPALSQKMQAMQTQIMSNPETMAEIQQMMQDPEIIKIMSDPAFVQAVSNKDVGAIQNNPRTQELMKNPKMQAFIDKLRSSSQPSGSSSNN